MDVRAHRPGGVESAAAPLLRVHVVAPYGIVGGAEIWLLRLLDSTRRLEVTVSMLADGPLRGELEDRGIPVTVRPTGRTGWAVLSAGPGLVRTLRRLRPDVVLANGVKAAAAVLPAARLAGVPLVWVKHDHSFDGVLSRALGRWSDRVVATSDDLVPATGRDDAVVVPPPRPDEPASRQRARAFWKERGLDLGPSPTLAMATRLVPYKGVEDAIAALALEPAREWRLIVLGIDDPAAPEERDRLARRAASLDVADRVELLPTTPEAGGWLAAFDAVAVLTRDDERGFRREGFGIAGLEAMLAGLPVVTTTGGALAGLVGDRAGVCVPPADPAAVAAALAELGAREERGRRGRAGRAIAEAHPDARTTAARLAGVLAETAARSGAGLAGKDPVSVVVPILNEGPAVDRLLRPLVAQLRPGDEVIVVDAGSEDDSRARAERWAERDARVRVVEAAGANAARGRNTGIGVATHDLIACTDGGCEPAQGWLDALRGALGEADPPALVTGVFRIASPGVFGSAMAVAGYPDPDEARRRGPLTRIYGRLLGRVFEPSRPDGKSMGFTRAAWETAGGFPEHLDTAEDPSFGRAVADAGGRCVLSVDAEVRWGEELTPGSMARRYHRYGIGDGLAGEPRAVIRNLARAAAYLGLPFLLAFGGRAGRIAALAGAAAYLSLPLVRAFRGRRAVATAALVPLALAVKDVAKASGCVVGLARRARRRSG